MKAMLKSELARCAGVSPRTFSRWCEPFRAELEALGWTPNKKLLDPRIIEFLCDRLCLDVP